MERIEPLTRPQAEEAGWDVETTFSPDGDYVTQEQLTETLEGYLKLSSETTQLINSHISLGMTVDGNGNPKHAELLLRRQSGGDEAGIFLGVYPDEDPITYPQDYTQEEHGSTSDPFVINHNSISSNGRDVGIRPLVNRRTGTGPQVKDNVVLGSEYDTTIPQLTTEINNQAEEITNVTGRVSTTETHIVTLDDQLATAQTQIADLIQGADSTQGSINNINDELVVIHADINTTQMQAQAAFNLADNALPRATFATYQNDNLRFSDSTNLQGNGANIAFTVGVIDVTVTRTNDSQITVTVATNDGSTLPVLIQRNAWGGATADCQPSAAYTLTSTPTDLPSLVTGTYFRVLYEVQTPTHTYHVSASRNNDYTVCRLTVDGFKNNS